MSYMTLCHEVTGATLFALPTALDFFAEFTHVVEASAWRLLRSRRGSHTVGIDASGWHIFLESHRSFFLKLPESLSIDISTERPRVDAPFPRRSAALIERHTPGFGVGIFGHQTSPLGAPRMARISEGL